MFVSFVASVVITSDFASSTAGRSPSYTRSCVFHRYEKYLCVLFLFFARRPNRDEKTKRKKKTNKTDPFCHSGRPSSNSATAMIHTRGGCAEAVTTITDGRRIRVFIYINPTGAAVAPRVQNRRTDFWIKIRWARYKTQYETETHGDISLRGRARSARV